MKVQVMEKENLPKTEVKYKSIYEGFVVTSVVNGAGTDAQVRML